jgi:hypothetical protein
MAKCLGREHKAVEPRAYDPLHISGRPQRRDLYRSLERIRPQMVGLGKETEAAARTGARDPGWGDARTLAGSTIRGDYLNGSPQLNKAVGQMRSAAGREAGDAAANIRDQFSRNGMSFGTANQQAQQSAQAAATARANDTESAMRLDDYQQERQNQVNAVDMLGNATTIPVQLQQAADKAGMSELEYLSQMAQIVQAMSGNGQLIKPDMVEEIGLGDQFMKAVGYVL